MLEPENVLYTYMCVYVKYVLIYSLTSELFVLKRFDLFILNLYFHDWTFSKLNTHIHSVCLYSMDFKF